MVAVISGLSRRGVASVLLATGVAIGVVAPPEPTGTPAVEEAPQVLTDQLTPASPPPTVPTPAAPTPVSPTPVSPTPVSPASPWPDVFTLTSSGVTRIAATTCDGGWSGSGFLVDPSTVLTAAHVVAGASSIALRFADDVYAGRPVLLDLEHDLALVRLEGEATGHSFAVAPAHPRVGEDVAVLGHPFGRPLAMARGTVTAVDQRVAIDGQDRFGLLRTDAAVNPGASGGPMVDAHGQVVGLVTAGGFWAGEGWATSQPVIADFVASATEVADPVDLAICPIDHEPDTVGVPVSVTVSSPSPDAPSIAQALQLHAQWINDGDVERVFWELMTPRMRAHVGSLDTYAEQVASTSWLSVEVVEVDVVDAVTDQVQVAARSVQHAEHEPDEATCTDWRLTYTLALDEGFWQLDHEELTDGQPPTACEAAPEPGAPDPGA